MSLGGVAAVMTAAALWGWTVPERAPVVVLWHRRLAIAAALMIVLVAVTGARRMRIHTRLYVVFVPLYVLVLVLAIIGYRP